MGILVRPATQEDAAEAAELLYSAAAPAFERFAGGRARATGLLRELFPHAGHAASYEVTSLAVRAGQLVGALAAFPVADGDRLVWRTVRLQFPRIAPWHWPRAAVTMRALSSLSPPAPADAYYVDALAVSPLHRREGVARALLDCASERARSTGYGRLALATSTDNLAGQALYRDYGFVELARREAGPRRARLGGYPGLISYVLDL